jgi:hypothetical protein
MKVSSGMLRRVALVRTDVSEELSASFIRVTGIGELGTTLAVPSNRQEFFEACLVVLQFWMLVLWTSCSASEHGHIKNGVVQDVTPCGSCNNRRFGGT